MLTKEQRDRLPSEFIKKLDEMNQERSDAEGEFIALANDFQAIFTGLFFSTPDHEERTKIGMCAKFALTHMLVSFALQVCTREPEATLDFASTLMADLNESVPLHIRLAQAPGAIHKMKLSGRSNARN